MIEYIYRGCKISYKVDGYKANGQASCLLDTLKSFTPANLSVEYNSQESSEYEIRKLLENHVDCELKNFYEMQKKENLN